MIGIPGVEPDVYYEYPDVDTTKPSPADTEYIELAFHADAAKMLPDLPRPLEAGEIAVVRCYRAGPNKTVIDRDTDLLTPAEVKTHWQLVVQAMYDELKLWVDNGCISRKQRRLARNIIDCRWVLKWKWVMVDGKSVRVIRARLTVRGFKDVDAQGLSAYAGTASRWAQRLIVSEAVARGWVLASADVRKAFLQGVTYKELAEMTGEPEREVNFVLPKNSVPILKRLPGFTDFNAILEVLHCDKPGTGLRDAPRCFSMKLRKGTQECGLVSLQSDPELEAIHEAGQLMMVLAKHVDDLKFAAPKPWIEWVLQKLEKIFGKIEVQYYQFTNCGVRHLQDENTLECELDQIQFIQAVKPMHMPEMIGAPADRILSESAQSQFLSLLMTMAYALITRMDLAIYIASLQKVASKATVLHARRLNILVRWAQKNPKTLRYRRINGKLDALMQLSDSAFKAEETTGLSMRGCLSLRMKSHDLRQGDVACHVLDFVSKSQRHVTRATFSSELFAGTDALDAGILLLLALHELEVGPVTPDAARHLREQGGTAVKLFLGLDAMSVFAAITAMILKVPAETSLVVHLRWVRNLLDCGILDAIVWVDTRSMASDGLTKGAIDRKALHEVMDGIWKVEQELKTWRSPSRSQSETWRSPTRATSSTTCPTSGSTSPSSGHTERTRLFVRPVAAAQGAEEAPEAGASPRAELTS